MLIGVVGKANVGKSTFFKALTLADVLIANYPFATIDPNKGFAFVRVKCVDRELGVQCNPRTGYCVDGTRFVPVEVMDVAGLVPGAHLGKGLGLAFLDDLSSADCLIHVVDMAGTTNEKGEPIEPGGYDPADDIRFLEEEIDQWYLGMLKKQWEKFAKKAHLEHVTNRAALFKQFSGVGATENLIGELLLKTNLADTRLDLWTEDDLTRFSRQLRITTKPMVIAANKMDLPTAAANLEKIKKEFPHLTIVPVSAESELALKEADKHKLIKYVPGSADFSMTGTLNDKQRKALEYIRDTVLKKYNGSGVQECIETAVFNMLHYIAIFPGGVNKLTDSQGRVLPDCFLLRPNSTALDFAFKLHSDFGNKFIRAIDVKTKKTVGKEHVLKHRDVIEIVANA
jgi:ribosome-binding ATPase YchF (GTP1/OBG family)